MVAFNRLLALVAPLAVLTLAPTLALADDDGAAPAPVVVAPPPAPGQVYTPLYTAPLSQTTQTTYVPQSVALSGPDEISEVADGQQAPLGYTAVERKRKGLIIGGAATLGASYAICALTAAIGQDVNSNESNPVGAMWIPIAGPFIQIGNSSSATEDVFLVGLGAAQVAGAVMLYYGMTSTKRVFVRNDLVSNVMIAPMVTNNAQGFALSGNF